MSTARNRGVCKFFLEGRCLKGANCNYAHVAPAATGSPQLEASDGAFTRRHAAEAGGGHSAVFETRPPVAERLGPQSGGNGLLGAGGAGGFPGRGRGRAGGRGRGPAAGRAPSEAQVWWGGQQADGRGRRDGAAGPGRGRGRGGPPGERPRSRACKFFLEGHCSRGDSCAFLHAHASGPQLELVAELKGHQETVRALCLAASAAQLYSGGQDQVVRVWDCASAQCLSAIGTGADVGALLFHSGWLFAGLPNQVKIWVTDSGAEQVLDGPVGAVHALALAKGRLFVACQSGSILCWAFNDAAQRFEPAASLAGHSKAVVCLQSSPSQEHLVSGAMDGTIRVWDSASLACLQAVEAGGSVVMGLAFWRSFLLSCSLDGVVQVWSSNAASGLLECTYAHPEGTAGTGDGGASIRPPSSHDGALCLQVAQDVTGTDLVYVAYNDNTVRLYELPSFAERGVLFTRQEVRCMCYASAGVVITGDGSGDVKVWRNTQ